MSRILVLSDVHYPNTDLRLLDAALQGRYDEIVLLGDSVDIKGKLGELLSMLRPRADKVYLIRGDNEESMGIDGLERLELGNLVLFHGHQGNLVSEGFTKRLARLGRRINRRLVIELYAFRVRVPSKVAVVGHAHILDYSRLFKVVLSGSMAVPSEERPFNEEGYVVIDGNLIYLINGHGETVKVMSSGNSA